MTQEEALNVLLSGANTFLTGEPGSGKTYTINSFLAKRGKQGVAVTASTGLAATHINGRTVHSWCGVGIHKELTPGLTAKLRRNEALQERIQDADVLILDEISMVSGTLLTLVNEVCQLLRGDNAPFGGLQVVLVGDFFQLPPITDGPPDFAFSAPIWEEAGFTTCYLTEQHRCEDEPYMDLLTRIRRGESIGDRLDLLRGRYCGKSPPNVSDITQLFPHNARVDGVNYTELRKLPGETSAFDMTSWGPGPLIRMLKAACASPETLLLKTSARVMFTKNNHPMYVNGTTGVVESINNNRPKVRTTAGRLVVVEPDEWCMEENGQVVAGVKQLPLRLAWAITIHKSQGMSLDSAYIDLGKCFEYGQGYVALSRLRTAGGLILGGLNKKALEVHPLVLKKDEEFREQNGV